MATVQPHPPSPQRGPTLRTAPAVLFPALTVPVWVGDLHQAVWGRGGRWLAVAVGATLSTPYLVWTGVTAPLLMAADRLMGAGFAGRSIPR